MKASVFFFPFTIFFEKYDAIILDYSGWFGGQKTLIVKQNTANIY